MFGYGHGFPGQHGAFALGSPVIATETSVFSQHGVTGNQPADRIRTNGVADRARPRANSDSIGNGGVGSSRLPPEIDEGLPYFELEVGPTDADLDRGLTLACPNLARDFHSARIILFQGR